MHCLLISDNQNAESTTGKDEPKNAPERCRSILNSYTMYSQDACTENTITLPNLSPPPQLLSPPPRSIQSEVKPYVPPREDLPTQYSQPTLFHNNEYYEQPIPFDLARVHTLSHSGSIDTLVSSDNSIERVHTYENPITLRTPSIEAKKPGKSPVPAPRNLSKTSIEQEKLEMDT